MDGSQLRDVCVTNDIQMFKMSINLVCGSPSSNVWVFRSSTILQRGGLVYLTNVESRQTEVASS